MHKVCAVVLVLLVAVRPNVSYLFVLAEIFHFQQPMISFVTLPE